MKKLLTYILFTLFVYCSFFHVQSKHGFFELPIVSTFDTDIEERADFCPDISFEPNNVYHNDEIYQSMVVIYQFDVSNNSVASFYFLLDKLLNLPPPLAKKIAS